MKFRLTAILICAALLVACSEQKPIKIGFIGSLSGRAAEVSQAARDGTVIAVEDFNNKGGLRGRKVELKIYDDHHQEEKVREGIETLSESGVRGIIGPITSQMAVVAVPLANKRKIVLISPTSSTMELNKKQDYFFRTIATCEKNARSLAVYASGTLGAKRLAILRDTSNDAFTMPWQHCFSEQTIALGNEVIARESYNSMESDFSFIALAKKLLSAEPDAILVLSNSVDAALFSQQIYKLSNTPPALLGSDWSFAGDLVRYGGKSVEGFTFTTNLDMQSDDPDFNAFTKRFYARFGTQPRFPAVLAYEATQVLLQGLAKTSEGGDLKKSLEGLGEMKGLQGVIKLDQYGDIVRASHINEVKSGVFVSIKKMN